MAGISEKKRARKDDEVESKQNEDEIVEAEGSDEEMEEEEEINDEMMQLDFEGRKPESLHYNGISTLLHQVFLKMTVDVADMADWIIKHNNVGSVLQQLEPSDDDDEDITDDTVDSDGMVMSVTTIVNITNDKDVKFAKEIKTLLSQRCKSHANSSSKKLEEILTNAKLGFLVNERMIGLPPHVTVFDSLWKDLEKAQKTEPEYNFSHFLLFSKTLRPMKTKKSTKEVERHFMNVEEELFYRNSVLSFEFSVKDQCDTVTSTAWEDNNDDESDGEEEAYEPFRTVMIVTADKIPEIMSQMATWITSN